MGDVRPVGDDDKAVLGLFSPLHKTGFTTQSGWGKQYQQQQRSRSINPHRLIPFDQQQKLDNIEQDNNWVKRQINVLGRKVKETDDKQSQMFMNIANKTMHGPKKLKLMYASPDRKNEE